MDKFFIGQRLDGTGLYFYNARYYDPTIGRFISPDTIIPNPANPQCFNRYSYCLNNPLKYTDPSGHDSLRDFEGYCWIDTLKWYEWYLMMAGTAVTGANVVYTLRNDKNKIDTQHSGPGFHLPNTDGQQGGDDYKGGPGKLGPVIKTIAIIVAIVVGTGITAAQVSGVLQQMDETSDPEPALPIKKKSEKSSQVIFGDGSSGDFTAEQINQLQNIGVKVKNVEITHHVIFSDGSVGNYTNEQLLQMQIMGVSIKSVD